MSSNNVKAPTSRNNTALHVCWHRGVTVSLEDHIKSSEVSRIGTCLELIFTKFYLLFAEPNFGVFIEKVQELVGVAEIMVNCVIS